MLKNTRYNKKNWNSGEFRFLQIWEFSVENWCENGVRRKFWCCFCCLKPPNSKENRGNPQTPTFREKKGFWWWKVHEKSGKNGAGTPEIDKCGEGLMDGRGWWIVCVCVGGRGRRAEIRGWDGGGAILVISLILKYLLKFQHFKRVLFNTFIVDKVLPSLLAIFFWVFRMRKKICSGYFRFFTAWFSKLFTCTFLFNRHVFSKFCQEHFAKFHGHVWAFFVTGIFPNFTAIFFRSFTGIIKLHDKKNTANPFPTNSIRQLVDTQT